ncbi:MAG: acyl-CoA synthetase FdrA [Armatimonadota bacterium]
MNTYIDIKKNSYFDSVTLMLLSRKLTDTKGVKSASVSMGTDHNKSILADMGFKDKKIEGAGVNDLVIAICVENEALIKTALDVINNHFTSSADDEEDEEYNPATFEGALKSQPDTNLALISIPGEYAAREARKCLDNNINVMIFSDNVSIEDEKNLKQYADEKRLLVMGPDCGTAIIDGKPLAFANLVRRGKVGIVGAAGTGIQEVSVCVHKLGEGISQAIGTGGRDLSNEVGGITMLAGLEMLLNDNNTSVIILISKPPEKEVAGKILNRIKNASKPVVVHFIGAPEGEIASSGAIYAQTLADSAVKACGVISSGIQEKAFDTDTEKIIKQEKEKYKSGQKYVRGFYTGGTVCKEAILMLSGFSPIYSNIPLDKKYKLSDSGKSIENTVLDLGEDEFTQGRPHPMIDPVSRNERMLADKDLDNIRIIILDVMLGYGSHPDPAGELVKAVTTIRDEANKKNIHITFLAEVCGTEDDPQKYSDQKKILEDAGIIVMPTNAEMVKLAKILLN